MKQDRKVEIELSSLSFLVPFILEVDRQFSVVWASNSFLRYHKYIPGKNIKEVLKIYIEKKELPFHKLPELINTTCNVVFKVNDKKILLRGRWLKIESGFLLLAFPEVTMTDKLADFLMSEEEAKISLQDAARITEIFKKRNQELQLTRKELEQEISRRKEIQESLVESEERYRDLFENATDLIQIVDAEGKFIYVNKRWSEVLGYTREEAKEICIFDIIHPKHRKHCRQVFQRVLQGERMDNVETIFVSKNGKQIFVEGNVNARFKDGKFYTTRAIFHDITERKKMEDELIKARQQALLASKSKSEFLASMSHEIRTPMNAIVGMAELLAETPLNDEQRYYVQIFKNAGENLLNIINDILDISKIEAGQIELEKIEFDLNDLLDRTCEIMAIRAHKKNLELACHITPDVPTHLIGDPVRLRQILVNLVGNAIKFTEQGEVVVEVKKEMTEGNTVIIKFAVRDTGIGIPNDTKDKIFESFTQADSSHTRKYGGTGLGLAISKQLVELMEGRIWVESEVNKGSTFYFTAQFQIAPKVKEPEVLSEVNLKGMKALVVDDNATNRLILKDILSNWGVSVSEAESGEKAIASLLRASKKSENYDFVILDCRMPGMGGFDVAREIKKYPELKTTTIMMLTSDRRKGDIQRCQEMNIASYLVKPIKKNDLKRAIELALGKVVVFKTMQPSTSASAPRIKKSSNLLVVEDTEDNRFLIKAYLKGMPINLDFAENGAIAVEKFKQKSYDLVLMDVQMPVMDGYTATKEIRKFEKENGTGHTPIIALSAYALKEEMEKSIKAGCDAHLTKPIKKKVLLNEIAKFIGGDKNGR